MILDDVQALETRADLSGLVSGLFDKVSPASSVVQRADAAARGEIDQALWSRLNGEIGVVGLTVPEGLGGAGATIAESAVVLEQIGRRAAAIPFLGSFLAVEALVRGGQARAQERWLTELVQGEAQGAVAWPADLSAQRRGDLWTVTGSVDLVIDGFGADVLVVPASTPEGRQWLAVDLAGVERTRREALDLTRELASLVINEAPGVEIAEGGRFADLEAYLESLAVLALSVEQLGVAEQALEDALAYAKVREQFGRTIGSFQAVKHLLADMATEADLARSLVEHAVWACVANPSDFSEAASLAMLGASRAAVFITGENVQVHGGIGFSWEHPAHLYFRKARSNEVLLGSRATFSDRVLAAHGVAP